LSFGRTRVLVSVGQARVLTWFIDSDLRIEAMVQAIESRATKTNRKHGSKQF
jgi:hypothetical protein